MKQIVPHIAAIVGEKFNYWERVAEMVENDGKLVRTDNKIQFDDGETIDEGFAVECAYLAYANRRNLPL